MNKILNRRTASMMSSMQTVKAKATNVRLRWGWIVVSILMLAFVLRLRTLNVESVYIDEGFSIVLASHPIPEIILGSDGDVHPPLYFVILHFWMLLGSGVFAARYLSVLIGVLQVAQIIQLGRRMGIVWVGVGAASLLAVAPFHILYSQDARQYALLSSITTAATSELWLCLQGKNRWVGYFFFSLLSLYTQYFAGFVLLAHGVFVAAWALAGKQSRVLLHWSLVALFVLIGFSPWIPVMMDQIRFHKMTWLFPPDLSAVRDTILVLFEGTLVYDLPLQVRWAGLGILGLLILWGLAQVSWRQTEMRRPFAFLAVWAVVPFSVVAPISLQFPIFQSKQFLLLVTAFLLWVMLITSTLPRPVGAVFIAILVMVSFVFTLRQQSFQVKEDWRGTAAYISNRFTEGDVAFANMSSAIIPLSVYWSPPQFAGYPTDFDIIKGGYVGERITPEVADRIMQDEARKYERLWLVEYGPAYWDPQRTIEQWLDQHGHLETDQLFRGIRVRLYRFQAGERAF